MVLVALQIPIPFHNMLLLLILFIPVSLIVNGIFFHLSQIQFFDILLTGKEGTRQKMHRRAT